MVLQLPNIFLGVVVESRNRVERKEKKLLILLLIQCSIINLIIVQNNKIPKPMSILIVLRFAK